MFTFEPSHYLLVRLQVYYMTFVPILLIVYYQLKNWLIFYQRPQTSETAR